ILDDVIAYILTSNEILFVFNAANRLTDIRWFEAQRDKRALDTTLVDRTLETALIGVQGPHAQASVQSICDADLARLAGYAFVTARVADAEALVSRTGYTGEDGFEILVDAAAAEGVWRRLQENACACGLGARDTLRTEAGFALYGHDIDTT